MGRSKNLVVRSQSDLANFFDPEHKMTGLHMAALYNAPEVAKYYCGVRGIKLNIRDSKGRTPLMVACATGSEEVVKILCQKRNLELESKDNLGRNLEFYIRGNETIKALLDGWRKRFSRGSRLSDVEATMKDLTDLSIEELKSSSHKQETSKNVKITVTRKIRPLCFNTFCNIESRHRCSNCLKASFCSVQCSIDYWPIHKSKCQEKPRKSKMKPKTLFCLSEVD